MKEEDDVSVHSVASDTTKQYGADHTISSNSVPVLIKKDVWRKSVMLCQLDDPKLSFTGDTGAIGRITVDKSHLQLDLKGRQYEGLITAGPTVLLLNLAPPVGLKVPGKQVARAEMVTNEFCHLRFTKDVLGAIMGEYSGGLSRNANYSDEESVAGTDAGPADTGAREKGKKRAPAISNVTNRKRKMGPGKKGASKKRK